ncbi:helix-loop-helix DNA-binding domain-containing protein [Sarocladium implicatum]|nr:helix-loop-helix DNA-binding domain-containing protein [Sarocladium implicatum]
MGSSQPPTDEFMPFGYEFNQPPEPLREAPEPAPGHPLLSETDSKLLSSFFDDLTADQYNMPSFGEGLNFSNAWFDLPPQFMGSATSLGQQPELPSVSPTALTSPNEQQGLQRQALMSNMMPPPPPPSQGNSTQARQPQLQYDNQHHSEDVLHAAATLLQNGAGRGDHIDINQARRTMGPPVGHLRHQPMEEFKEEARKAQMVEYPDENTFMDWMGSASTQPQRSHSRIMPVADYQWGSDSNFTSTRAYAPGAKKDSVESHQRQQLTMLECLEPSKSTGNTRPNSPQASGSNSASISGGAQAPKASEDPEAPPRKRRKSKIAKAESNPDDNEDFEDMSSSKAARRRKPKSEQSQTSSPTTPSEPASGKRRKSAVNGGKAARENLSEEQKRENHIKSEQKRRTLIKEGFDDLCDLIPGLQSRGLSKSTMLSMTAEYLEQLLEGNKELSEQLAALKENS